MLASLKSEFRKLLTVRSTYFITGILVILVIFVAFFLEGWRANAGQLADPLQLAGDATGALGTTVFGAIVAILLVTHEYRYNTVLYTLTNSNSRSKVLVSKFIVASLFAVFLTVLIGVLSPIMSYLGIHAHGHTLVPQTLHYWSLIWRCLFYGWGFGMAGFLFAVLTRNQIASIVALFVIPGVVEQLLGMLLFKHNSIYLPFTALSQVLSGPSSGSPISSSFSSLHAAAIYSVYLIVGAVVAWFLFLKRDAN